MSDPIPNYEALREAWEELEKVSAAQGWAKGDTAVWNVPPNTGIRERVTLIAPAMLLRSDYWWIRREGTLSTLIARIDELERITN